MKKSGFGFCLREIRGLLRKILTKPYEELFKFMKAIKISIIKVIGGLMKGISLSVGLFLFMGILVDILLKI